MNLAELQDRIARWEDLHTNFKERIESPDELARDLACFANTDRNGYRHRPLHGYVTLVA